MRGAPVWILLRGLSRESAHWGPFVPALAAAMPEATIAALDLPGTGTRLAERAPRTIGETMERVREAAAARAPKGTPVLLFGLSLGGMVAMEWAARHAEELTAVVVAASSASDVSPLRERFSPRGFAAAALNLMTRDAERRQARMARLVLNRQDLRGSAARAWAEIERARPLAIATVRAQMTAADRWRAPSSLRTPSLFLVGTKDRLVHADCSRALARRYGAPLVEHPEAGHDLTTDATEWVADEIVRFARSVAARS